MTVLRPAPTDQSRAIDRSAPILPRAVGQARVTAARRGDGSTGLTERFSQQPYRLLVPTAAEGEPTTVVLGNLSGGILNGDQYTLTATATAGAQVLITGQAAEKIYRAADDRPAHVTNTVHVHSGAAVEWIPQGTIQFDGARLMRRTTLNVAADAQLLAGELLYLGRTAMGEAITNGLLSDHWTVSVADKAVWQDHFLMTDRTMAALQDPAGLDSAAATAMLLYVAPDASDILDDVRTLADTAPDGCRYGATVVNGVLLVRWLARDAQALRTHFGQVAGWMRARTLNRPAALPRLWYI